MLHDTGDMLSFFLDLLFPRHSLTGREGEWITAEEQYQLVSRPVVLSTPQLRALGLEYIDCVVAGTKYHECPLMKKAIHTFKYHRVSGLADALGAVLIEASDLLLRRTPVCDIPPVLCPVPLHWIRQFQRGFNQSELLASFVAREHGWPVAYLLMRTHWTGVQALRSRDARFHAMRDAFTMRMGDRPSHVILIDDISTTGATLNMCAKALKGAGVGRVEGLVVAHG